MPVSPSRSARRAAALLAAAVLGVIAGPGAATGVAAGSPDLSLGVDAGGQVLAGGDGRITLTAQNPGGGPTAHALSYRAVLGAGATYVPGTAGAAGDPLVVVNQPSAGQRTLIWRSVADVPAGGRHLLRFTARASGLAPGQPLTVTAGAYASDDPADAPPFTPTGQADTSSGHPATGSDTGRTDSAIVQALAVRLARSGITGGRQLRGAHDHPSTVSLDVTAAGSGSTTFGTTLEHWLPAGLEYLGCSGRTSDHTTAAPTNTGGATPSDEYPGSGPLVPPAVPGCTPPDEITTVTVDPPGSPPPGVYTRLRWNVGALTAGSTFSARFAVAPPLRANTTSWPSGAPTSTSRGQGANLDNNAGPETVAGTVLAEAAQVSGTSGFSQPVSASTELTSRTADVAASLTPSSTQLTPGATTTWLLGVRAGEYRSVASAAARVTLPSGLCPVDGSANLTQAPQDGADTADCGPASPPSLPYAAASEHADGTWSLRWDETTVPALAELGPGAQQTLTFDTRTRPRYQQAFAPAAAISAGDRVTVAADGTGTARVLCGSGAVCAPGGPHGDELSHDGPLDQSGTSGADTPTLTAASPTLDQRIGLAGGDCTAATYADLAPAFRPGDRVCLLLRVDHPVAVAAGAEQIAEVLPAELGFDALDPSGGDAATAADTLGAATLDARGATPGPGGALRWLPPAGEVAGGSTFEHRIAARAALPAGARDGLSAEIRGRAAVRTAAAPDGATELGDGSAFTLSLPTVTLTRRITAVDGSPVSPTADQTVRGGQDVTIRLRTANAGSVDAERLELWDRLPAPFTCADVAAAGAIPDGGACSGGVVRWGAAPATGPTAPAGGSVDRSYVVRVPTSVEIGQVMTSSAGVRRFETSTNTGGAFTYVPSSNIDPSIESSANVEPAGDVATLRGALPTVDVSRTTSIVETGNVAGQATVGETIAYTARIVLPAGLTVRDGGLLAPLDARHAYVPGTLRQLTGPAPWTTSDASPVALAAEGAASWTAPTGADSAFTFGYDATVVDAAANVRTGTGLAHAPQVRWTPSGAASGATRQVIAAAASSTPVVEPALSLVRTDDTGGTPVIGGQVVRHTLTASNGPGSQVSIAHELDLTATVPAGVTPIDAAGDPVPEGGQTEDGGVWDAATRTLTFPQRATLDPGTAHVVSYRVRIDDPAPAAAQFTSTATVGATSLAGAVTGERTSSTSIGGYRAAAARTLVVAAPTITQVASDAARTPGQRVRFTVDVTLPPHTRMWDVVVSAVVADALDVDGYQPSGPASCVTGCTTGTEPQISGFDPTVSGTTTTVGWSLGDVVDAPQQRTIRLAYDTHLRLARRGSSIPVTRPATTTATPTLRYDQQDRITAPHDPASIPAPAGGYDRTTSGSSSFVTVVEPGVALDATLAVGAGSLVQGPVTAHDRDVVSYRLRVANPGDAPLHDVAVSAQLDPRLRSVVTAGGLSTTTVTKAWSDADPTITWLLPAPIAAGGTVDLQLTAQMPEITSVRDGDRLDVVAQVGSAYGVPQTTRTADGFLYRSYAAAPDTARVQYEAPKLELAMTTGATGFPESAQAEVGQPFRWRVVVTNRSATETGTAVTVDVRLPQQWSYRGGSASFTPGGALEPAVSPDAAGDRLRWSTGLDLAPGASRTLVFEALPSRETARDHGTGPASPHVATAQASVLNSAGSGADGAGTFSSASDPASAVLQVPVLTVVATPDAAATAGTAVAHRIRIENSGTVRARNVVVRALRSASVTEAGTPTVTPSAGVTSTQPGPTERRWVIPEIAAGARVDVDLGLALPAGLPAGALLSLQASASADEILLTPSDDALLDVVTRADLSASLSPSASSVVAGRSLVYTAGVVNAGPSVAPSAVLTLALPPAARPQALPTGCVYDAGTQTVRCGMGDLAPGQAASRSIGVDVDPGASGPASATLTTASGAADPSSADDTATSSVAVTQQADLRLASLRVSPDPVPRTANATVTASWRHDGPSNAAGAQVTVELPPALAFDSGPAGCSAAGSTVTCTIAGPLAPGVSGTIELVASTAAASSSAPVSATITGTTPDPDGSNDGAATTTSVVASARIVTSLTADSDVAAGGTMRWVLGAEQRGPDDATGVVLSTTLPAGVTFERGDPGCAAVGQVVTCPVGALASGATASREIVVRVSAGLGGSLLAPGALASADQPSTRPGGDPATAPVQVGPAADLSTTVEGLDRLVAGETVPVTVTLANAGPSTATGARLVVDLPAGLTAGLGGVEARSARLAGGSALGRAGGDGCAIAGSQVTCSFASIASGAARVVRLSVAVPADRGGATAAFAARATANEPDPAPGNASTSTTVLIAAGAAPTPAPGAPGTDPSSPGQPAPGPPTSQGPSSGSGQPGGSSGGASSPTGGGPAGPGAGAGSQGSPGAAPLTKLSVRVSPSARRVRGGRAVDYRITVRNTGGRTARALRICATLGRGITFRSVRGGELDGSALCFARASLGKRKTLSIVVRARVSKRAGKGLYAVSAAAEARNARASSARTRVRVTTDGKVKASTIKGFAG